MVDFAVHKKIVAVLSGGRQEGEPIWGTFTLAKFNTFFGLAFKF